MAFYSFDRPLPTDIELVHEVRSQFELYRQARLMIIGTMDFAEKVGANVRKVEDALGDLEEVRKLAEDDYVSGEYQDSMETLNKAMKQADDVLALAFKVKDRAMLYIYMVQWLVTTGTFLLAGSVVYTLMIRRRLYRVVDTTRFDKRK